MSRVEFLGGPVDGVALPYGGRYVIVQSPAVAYLYEFFSGDRWEDRRYCLVSSKRKADLTLFSDNGTN